jgi:intracellular septation protein
MMGSQISAPDDIWKKLLVGWILFFLFMGAINLFVAFSYSTDIWVNFKLFGSMGLMLLFVVAQAFVLAPHIKDVNNKEGE